MVSPQRGRPIQVGLVKSEVFEQYLAVSETVPDFDNIVTTSVYPAKGRPGSRTTKLDSGAQKGDLKRA